MEIRIDYVCLQDQHDTRLTIPSMKHFVLAFLLFLSSFVYSSAQKIMAREIVDRTMNVHTEHNRVQRYLPEIRLRIQNLKEVFSREKIVYFAAYMNNAPIFMPFEEFEKRVLSTDFSIYKKWEK